MAVEQVCQLLSKLEGLNKANLGRYTNSFVENNINGTVLLHCELHELKDVLHMTFGDWELFRAMIENLREKESLSELPQNGGGGGGGGGGGRSRHTSREDKYRSIGEEEPRLKFTQDVSPIEKKLEIPKPSYSKYPIQGSSILEVEMHVAASTVSAPSVGSRGTSMRGIEKKDMVDSAIKRTKKTNQSILISKKDSQWGEIEYENEALRNAMQNVIVDSEEEEDEEEEEEEDSVLEILPLAEKATGNIGPQDKQLSPQEKPEVHRQKQKQSHLLNQESVESDMEEVVAAVKHDKSWHLGKVREEDKVSLIIENESSQLKTKTGSNLKSKKKSSSEPHCVGVQSAGQSSMIQMETFSSVENGVMANTSMDQSKLNEHLSQLSNVEEGIVLEGSMCSLHTGIHEDEPAVIMPAVSLEQLRKAAHVIDEAGPSAFKPVTPGSSQPASRAPSANSTRLSREGSLENFRMSLLQSGAEGEHKETRRKPASRSVSCTDTRKPSKSNLVAPPSGQQSTSRESLQQEAATGGSAESPLLGDDQSEDAKELFVSVAGKTVKVSLSKDESFI